MVDRAAVDARLARLDRELSMSERVSAEGRHRYLTDYGLQHQAERALQLAIQICIYVAVHLVAAQGLRAPDEYRDVFERLTHDDTLDPALAERLKDASGSEPPRSRLRRRRSGTDLGEARRGRRPARVRPLGARCGERPMTLSSSARNVRRAA